MIRCPKPAKLLNAESAEFAEKIRSSACSALSAFQILRVCLLGVLLSGSLNAASNSPINVQANDTTGALFRPAAFSSFLVPSQTGHSGKFLTTNGTASSWASIPGGGDMLAANNLSDLTNAGTALTNLGGTTVGKNVFTLTNPSAVTWFRINADNTIAARTAAQTRADLDLEAGTDFLAYPTGTPTGSKFLRDDNSWQTITGGGDLLAANNLSELTATAGTARTNLGATTVGSNLFTLTNPGAVTFLRLNADNTVTARSAANYRTDLSLVPGTDVQAYHANLAALAGLSGAADKGAYFTGSGAMALYDLSSAARTVLDDASVAAMVNTLGGATSTGTGGLVRQTDPIILAPNAAMAALEVDVTKLTNTKTLTGTTATLTLSATPTAGAVFGMRILGHTSDCTVTLWSGTVFDEGQNEVITTFVVPANSKQRIFVEYDGTTYFASGIPGRLTLTNPAAATTVTFASGGSFITAGAYSLTLTATGATNVTLPTTGTLATLAGAESFLNKKLGSLTTNGLVTTSGGDGTLSVTTPGTGVLTALAVNVGSAGAVVVNGGAIGTPSSGTLTNATGLPVSGITSSTSTPLGVGSVELGHASDTTLTRVSAGVVAIEGNNILTTTGTGQKDVWLVPIGDETTAITTGTAKVTFRAPYAATVTAVRASLTTASSSGLPTFDINEAGVSILSTKLTIDASEKTSTTAATAAVISDSTLADDAEITIDIDTAGTGAAGAKVVIYVTR